jgi:hypothetical protein
MQFVVGAIASFFLAKPLESPFVFDTRDLAWPLVAFTLAASMYAYDLMQVGGSRQKFKLWDTYLKADAAKLPIEYVAACRAQTNQTEQLVVFVPALFLGTLFFNARVSGALGIVWVLVRTAYAEHFRSSTALAFKDKGLGKFTIPCYMIISTLHIAAVFNVLRFSFGF